MVVVVVIEAVVVELAVVPESVVVLPTSQPQSTSQLEIQPASSGHQFSPSSHFNSKSMPC